MKRFSLLLLVLLWSFTGFAQTKDSISHFSGSVNVTNNGISLVPTFSLGKPAAIFLLSVGKGRLSFEPDMRFALEGKPWSFIFWWRYKAVQSGKFRLTVGAHPAVNFRTYRLPVNGDSTDVTVARRFLAGELAPNYLLSKNVSIGLYYLFAIGFDINTPKYGHFITVNSNISNIGLPGKLKLRFNPQFYYLKQDKRDGFYFTSAFTISKNNFPFSVSSIINKTLSGNILGSKDFVWNVSLIYSFNKNYVRHQ
ncbi:MAG: hypothetical protein HYR66_18555 [Sphingobacteriales bacterium]|nr:hypothetical protein [Sphingobacteriales bacterium]MBI3718475.1 hypothetical protein [Sphingobacteriales bacterium]